MNEILNQRYRLIEKISEGGTSSVYRAETIDNGAIVAVKTLRLPTASAEEIIRFHQETDFLAGLRHPHIIRVHERGVSGNAAMDESVHYLVMDFIEGCDLRSFMEQAKLDTGRAIDIMIQLGRALGALHAAGIIHGDLKPENIMISRRNGMRHATLVDFALSRMIDSRRQEPPAGTLCYMAPEKTGMLKHPVDERSDLYALGVIGYHLLAGRLPYSGKSLVELLHSQVAVCPAPPSEFNRQVPFLLDDIVMKLLEKDPSRRYQSAEGMTADLCEVRKGNEALVIGETDRPPKPDYAPKIKGRENELEQLYQLLDSGSRSDRVCFLAGEAGIGKTKLLETLADFAREKAFLVLQGRCVGRNNLTPWGLFQDLLSEYMKIFVQYPDEKKASISRTMKKENGDLGSIIIRLFPPVKLLLGTCPELFSLDLEKDTLRSFHAVTQFLTTLIRLEKMTVLILEDLQWVDSRSLDMLKDLIDALNDFGVVVMGSYRTNDVDAVHPLHDLIQTIGRKRNTTLMSIEPLTRRQTGAMVQSILKNPIDEPSGLFDFVFGKSRGNPLYTLEVVKSLLQKKVLIRQGNRFHFDNRDLEKVQIPQNLQDAILQSVDHLDETDACVLCDASILGKRFVIDTLIELERSNGLSAGKVLSCLDRARGHRIVETAAGLPYGYAVFSHDRIREAFYKKAGKLKASIHAKIGLLMEATYKGSERETNTLFDLAHHFIEGGNQEKILQYVYPAGLAALNRYDYELAVRYLTIIKEILERELAGKENAGTRTVWFQCCTKLGEAMIMAGRNKPGIDLLASLGPFSGSVFEKTSLYLRICTAYAMQGDWRECEKYGKSGLALMGETLPVEKKSLKCAITKKLLLVFLQKLIPGRFLKVHKPEVVLKTGLAMNFYKTIAAAMLLQDKYKLLYCALQLFRLSEIRTGRVEDLSESHCLFSVLCVTVGFWNIAGYYMQKAIAFSSSCGNVHIGARLHMYNGYFQQYKGEYRNARDSFLASTEMFDRIGDMGSSLHCRIGLIDTYAFQADHKNLVKLLKTFTRQAYKFGDTNCIASLMHKRAGLAFEKGHLEKAEKLALACLDYSRDNNSLNNLCWIHALMGAIQLEKDQAGQTIELLREGMAFYWERTVIGQYAVWNFPLYAEALIKARKSDGQISLSRIKKACRAALAKTKRWNNYHGVSLRAYAKYLHMAGRDRSAKKLFLKSIRLFETLGRRFETALTHREYGYFLRESGQQDAALAQLNRAWMLFKEMGSVFTMKLSDYPGPGNPSGNTAVQLIRVRKTAAMFMNTIDQTPGLTPKQIAQHIIETAVKITGARSGCLFLLDKQTGLMRLETVHHPSGRSPIDFSQGIVDKVHQSGLPVSSVDACSEHALISFKSVSLRQLRSVLCMPLLREGLVAGICYLSNRLSSGVFSKNEEMILGEFLSAASLRLENARLKKELEEIRDKKSEPAGNGAQGEIEPVLDYIHSHYTNEISRETIATALKMDPVQLGKRFKAGMNKTLKEYINELRLNHAYRLLLETDRKVIDIAYESGFESLRTFNRIFSEAMGDSPSGYRKHRSQKVETNTSPKKMKGELHCSRQ